MDTKIISFISPLKRKTNEINKLKEQIEKYRYSRDDKQTLYR